MQVFLFVFVRRLQHNCLCFVVAFNIFKFLFFRLARGQGLLLSQWLIPSYINLRDIQTSKTTINSYKYPPSQILWVSFCLFCFKPLLEMPPTPTHGWPGSHFGAPAGLGAGYAAGPRPQRRHPGARCSLPRRRFETAVRGGFAGLWVKTDFRFSWVF